MDIRIILNDIYTWVKNEPVLSKAIAAILAVIIISIFTKLPQRLIRWIKGEISTDFPFTRVRPDKLGELLENSSLTCYKNPFVRKQEHEDLITSDKISNHRRIYIGTAQSGKTRSAYEWIIGLTKNDRKAKVLVPELDLIPRISKKILPRLGNDTVVLFFDDIHSCLDPEKSHESEGIISPTSKFKELIEFFEKEYKNNLYVVCTARWEKGKLFRQ